MAGKSKTKGTDKASADEPVEAESTSTDLAADALSGWSPEQEELEAIRRFEAFEAVMDVSDRLAAGTWMHVPPKLNRYKLFRAGRRNDPMAEQRAYTMCQYGWFRVPPKVIGESGMHMTGFERDGADALILACPPETHARLEKRRRYLQRQRDMMIAQQFGADLKSIGSVGRGVSLEHITDEGEGAMGRIREEMGRMDKAKSL